MLVTAYLHNKCSREQALIEPNYNLRNGGIALVNGSITVKNGIAALVG